VDVIWFIIVVQNAILRDGPSISSFAMEWVNCLMKREKTQSERKKTNAKTNFKATTNIKMKDETTC